MPSLSDLQKQIAEHSEALATARESLADTLWPLRVATKRSGKYKFSTAELRSCRDIFVDNYQVKQNGCIEWTGRTERKNGYGVLCLRATDHSRDYTTHVLAYEITNGAIPAVVDSEPTMICHTCDNKSCINPKHLYAGNATTNGRDRRVAGRSNPLRGEEHYYAKFTEEDVVEIRNEYAGGKSQTEIAAERGVSQSGINRIVHGETWTHVGGPISTARRTGVYSGSKLTREDIVYIFRHPGLSDKKLGHLLGVGPRTIWAVRSGKRRATMVAELRQQGVI